MAELPPALLLMGATATGKTALAIALADTRPVRLISVDSVLVYRGMDIGSAKPDPRTLEQYPHALVDICDPAEPYSVADFREDALQEVREALAAGLLPVLVGGTSMYFKALVHGLGDLPSANPEVREKLEAEAGKIGWEGLHQRLQSLDPEAARRIPVANRQRIQRALEVYEVSGRPISSFWSMGADEKAWEEPALASDLPFRPVSFAVDPGDRDQLYSRINQRFLDMLAQGLIDEVAALRGRPDLNLSLPSMRSVGYRQVWEYLDGLYDHPDMIARGQAATRQLARRQWTWMRRWQGLQWLEGRPEESISRWVCRISESL